MEWDFDDQIDPGDDGPQVMEVHHRTGNNFLFADQHVEFNKVKGANVPQKGMYRFPFYWVPIDGLQVAGTP
jgi:hypothetical protein